jgi:hypothetical protein
MTVLSKVARDTFPVTPCQCCDQHCMDKGELTYKNFKILSSFWGAHFSSDQRALQIADLCPGKALLCRIQRRSWPEGTTGARRDATQRPVSRKQLRSMVRNIVNSYLSSQEIPLIYTKQRLITVWTKVYYWILLRANIFTLSILLCW